MQINHNSKENQQHNIRRRRFNNIIVAELEKQSENAQITFVKFMQECYEKKSIKNKYVPFINYLESIDYKKISFELLNEQQVYFMMRILNNWSSEIFLNTQKNEEFPVYLFTLTSFFRHVLKIFKIKYNNLQMCIASAFCFNNLATIFLRSKQYKMSFKYFKDAAQIYDDQQIANPVFSIVYTNLAILSNILGQSSKAEKYLLRGIKNSRAIHKQYLEEKETKETSEKKQTKSIRISQNLNILLHMYINLINLYESRNETKSKLEQVERAWIDLMNNKQYQINTKNWYIKYYYEKKNKINRYDMVFETLFKINIDDLRSFNSQELAQTPRRKEKLDPLKISNSFQLSQAKFQGRNYNKSRMREEQNKSSLKNEMELIYPSQKKYKKVNLVVPQYQDIQMSKDFSNIYSNNSTILSNKNSRKQNQIKPIIIFKKFKFEICFYKQGIIIKVPFTFIQERLDWDVVKYVITELELTELQESEIEVNYTEHFIACLLANHISINQTIQIKKKKIFDCCVKTQKFQYNFLYIGNKEFYVTITKIYDQQQQSKQSLFQQYQPQQKRFFVCFLQNLQRYFNVIKEDQYKLAMKNKILKEDEQERIYQLNAIKLKNDIDKPQFEKQIRPLLLEMENSSPCRENSFLKMILRYEENQGLTGTLFDLRQDNQQILYVVVAKNLKKYDCNVINIQEIKKTITFKYIQEEFGIHILQLNWHDNFWIKNYLGSLFQLKTHFIGGQVDYKNSERKNQIVFYLEKRTIENGTFIRKFVTNSKYYRPITVSVVGFKKKCFGIRFSFYNDLNIQEESLFILCNQDWYRLENGEKEKFLKNDISILNYHVLCGYVRELNILKTFQRLNHLKKQTKRSIFSLQKCLENTVYDN